MDLNAVIDAIITGETGVSSAGFPILSEASFQLWMNHVPHLFAEGSALLDRLHEKKLSIASGAHAESQVRAIKVLETVIQTAAVTAPSDLWLMKHILSSHHRAGILKQLKTGHPLDLRDLSTKEKLSLQQLRYDFHFLKSRAVVEGQVGKDVYALSSYPQIRLMLESFVPLDPAAPVNWLPLLKGCFDGSPLAADEKSQLEYFLTLPKDLSPAPNWIPGPLEMELGYRLLPLLLAYRSSPYYQSGLVKLIPDTVFGSELMNSCLREAGIVSGNGQATALGQRVLERGSGPFGIIHAYHEYMKHHEPLLHARAAHAWVARSENVAASQDANKKTFLMINDSIDCFMGRFDFKLGVFVEHAVGQGEATRQRFARSGSTGIQYFGADLEDAAIDRAMEAQKRGELPRDMRFVRQADIGEPQYLIDQLDAWGVSLKGSVMVVGNGFHEIRQQTNDKMIAMFKAYNEAGVLLIFTEESALSDEDLLQTGWNTYHAGFRYVHELSGQGLRPAYVYDQETDRLSWQACLENAGYWVHPGFTTHTRRIYPLPREGGYNPSISVNYFCVPAYLAEQLRQQSTIGRPSSKTSR